MTKKRSIKVYGQSGYKYRETPAILLKGQWLKESGFEIGDYISVTLEDGKLIIAQDTERAAVKAAEEEFMEREMKNLQKRYEKTYAYCVRLLDRIEQTEGYYQGIPIAMVGVVGYVPFPVTDLTLPVTSNMIGLNGDTLLYTGENYELFIRNYLGASLNILTPEEMGDIYYSEEYIEMESFPAASSVKLVDGIIYVKTENAGRD